MHFSIPDTQELYSEGTGTTYTGYNIYINGAYHCCLRYKQLHALHEQLRRRSLELGRGITLPQFPPKRLLPLTSNQLETRRAALEYYLQMIGQQAALAKSDLLQNFLLNAQLETALAEGSLDGYGGGGGYVTMEVLLSNGYVVPVTGRVNDNAHAFLQKVAQCVQLPISMLQYFALFLAKHIKTTNTPDNLVLIRRLMDFESPYLSRLHTTTPCQLLLRSNYWHTNYDWHLINHEVSLNLLFLQTVADVEHEWIIATPVLRQKLRALQMHGLKKEYLELARELPLYNCLQFQATQVDYPELTVEENMPATVLISIGNKELSIRLTRGAKIYETKFRVTRMRCWRVTAVHGNDNNSDGYEPMAQLSFEYLMSKQALRWITITSSQAMLMSVCLQSMVDELLQNSKDCPANTPESTSSNVSSLNGRSNTTLPTSSSLPTISSSSELNCSSVTSSPVAPVKFLSQRRSLKNKPHVYASTYDAVFFSKSSANLESVHNVAFQDTDDDDVVLP